MNRTVLDWIFRFLLFCAVLALAGSLVAQDLPVDLTGELSLCASADCGATITEYAMPWPQTLTFTLNGVDIIEAKVESENGLVKGVRMRSMDGTKECNVPEFVAAVRDLLRCLRPSDETLEMERMDAAIRKLHEQMDKCEWIAEEIK